MFGIRSVIIVSRRCFDIKLQQFYRFQLYIGFTFSFPCKQEGLASARLSCWTKGFTCSGVVNEDVVKMLQNAMDEKVNKHLIIGLNRDKSICTNKFRI